MGKRGRPRLDLTGQTFGRLKVLEAAKPLYCKTQRLSRWNCICECGVAVMVLLGGLRNGRTRSCGCLRLDLMRTARHTHKQTYAIWCGMLSRCNNKNNYSYHNYGCRGIKVCKRWRIFENFLADMGDKPAGLSLDRKNNNGNYTKRNCRWATQDEQSFNRRNNRYLKFGSETLTVTEWKRKTGLSYDQILQRFYNKKDLP